MAGRISRRTMLKASGVLASAAVGEPLRASMPEAQAVTPALIEAARREGEVRFYTAMDIPIAERFAKAFEAKYSGIAVRVERSGSERLFQRIGQEQESRIFAVDVVNTADASHCISWKRQGWLAPYVPEDVARYFPPEQVDADGMYATMRVWLSAIGYNTNLVKPEEAPKSFADLLDRKWMGKIVKGHPAYSGTIMAATFQIARELGWSYFEQLAKQKVLQVQSSTDPPKKLALGERAVMADGNDYNLVLLKESGQPVEVVHPAEGTPLISGPNAIFKNAPHPNAARLLQSYLFSLEAQQMLVDAAAQHSFHALVKEKPGRTPLRDIRLMRDDPAAVEAQSEEIKAKYTQYFHI
jgi:iron(III) transport system substrate-binding protein